MQFVLIMAILAALAISESAPAEPVAGAAWRLATAGVAVALLGLSALAVSRQIAGRLRTNSAEGDVLLRRFKFVRRAYVFLWLATAGGISCWLDWAQLVRFNWELDRLFLVDELLLLLPVVLPPVLCWAAFYDVDRAVRVARAAPTGMPPEPVGRMQYVAFHVRFFFGIPLALILGLMVVQDAMQLFLPDVVEMGYGPVVLSAAITAMFLLSPVLLRYVWQTQPLPAGPLRTRLEFAAQRLGIETRDILIWHTGGMVIGAAMAGVLRPLRYVFLSDALLARLTEEEIAAVFGHEAGHVRHHHLLLRVMSLVAPLSLLLLLEQVFPAVLRQLDGWLGTGPLGVQAPTGLLILAGMGCYLLVVFGHYSRLLEHQADLFGCRSFEPNPHGGAVETFSSALEKMAAANGIGRRAPGWQHASIARRVDFLGRVSHDPNRELRFQRRVRLLSILVIGIVVSPVAYRLLLG